MEQVQMDLPKTVVLPFSQCADALEARDFSIAIPAIALSVCRSPMPGALPPRAPHRACWVLRKTPPSRLRELNMFTRIR